MGVKEVLYRTRHLGWGADTQLYRDAAAFAAEFPARLRVSGPRVLKQNRGNGGQGVWKVEIVRGANTVRVLHARRAFDPTSGPRHLQGAYVDRDEINSRWRVLKRELEAR